MKQIHLSRQQDHFLGLISGTVMPMAFDAQGDMSERQRGFLDGVNFAMQIIVAAGRVPQSPRDFDRHESHLTGCAIRRGGGCNCHEIMQGWAAPGKEGAA